MALVKRTEEEKAARDAAKTQKRHDKEEARRQAEFQKAWNAFWASPAGMARRSFENGDHVFQYSLDVVNQDAVVVAMIGSTTRKKQADATDVLNAVAREGWELVNGDFVFVMEGQQSRDKFMTSGQNVAVKGTVLGYYLFKRSEANRYTETEEELRRRLWAPIVGAA
jgi:hypothetical protein